MNKVVFKKGVNAGYKSLLELKREREAEEKLKSPEKVRNLFTGFIGGDAFATKKGFRGNALDSNWGKHIFISFKNDDLELFEVAMRSSLADVHEVVSGGEFGSAFLIGDIGFYSDNFFAAQAKLLKDGEREMNAGTMFLSRAEWEKVDAKIDEMAHFSNFRAKRAIRGDTFASLALRENAFCVAKAMIDRGVDPLLENEEGDDLFVILKQQYSDLGLELHEVTLEIEATTHSILVPSEQRKLEEREHTVIQNIHNMIAFLDSVVANLTLRLQRIHGDKKEQRMAELRKTKLSAYQLWNIAQEDKAMDHIKECGELRAYLQERLDQHAKNSVSHVTLATLMLRQNAKNSSKKALLVRRDSNASNVSHASDAKSARSGAGGSAGGSGEVLAISGGGEAFKQDKQELKEEVEEEDEPDGEEDAQATAQLMALMGIAGDTSQEKKAGVSAALKPEEEKLGEILGVLHQDEFEQTFYR